MCFFLLFLFSSSSSAFCFCFFFFFSSSCFFNLLFLLFLLLIIIILLLLRFLLLVLSLVAVAVFVAAAVDFVAAEAAEAGPFPSAERSSVLHSTFKPSEQVPVPVRTKLGCKGMHRSARFEMHRVSAIRGKRLPKW